MGEQTRQEAPAKRPTPAQKTPAPQSDRQPARGSSVPPLHRAAGNSVIQWQAAPGIGSPSSRGFPGNRALQAALHGDIGTGIVTVPQIEAKIRSVLAKRHSSPQVGAGHAAFNANPRDAKASLYNSHFRDDTERIAFAIGVFESFLGVGGGDVDPADLFDTLVAYEIQVQRKVADLVVHDPPTADEEQKLNALLHRREVQAAAEAAERARQRAEYWANQIGALSEQTAEMPADVQALAQQLLLKWQELSPGGQGGEQVQRAVLEEVAAVFEQVLRAADQAIQAECLANPPGRLMKFHGDPCEPMFDGPRRIAEHDIQTFKMVLWIKKDEDGVPYRSVVYWLKELVARSQTVPATMAGAHLRVLQAKALLSQALSLSAQPSRGAALRSLPGRGRPIALPARPTPPPVRPTPVPQATPPVRPTPVPQATPPAPTRSPAPLPPAGPAKGPTPTTSTSPAGPATPAPKAAPAPPALSKPPASKPPSPPKKFFRDAFFAAAMRGAEASDIAPGIGAGGTSAAGRPVAASVQASSPRAAAPTPTVRTPAPPPSRPTTRPTPDTPAPPPARAEAAPTTPAASPTPAPTQASASTPAASPKPSRTRASRSTPTASPTQVAPNTPAASPTPATQASANTPAASPKPARTRTPRSTPATSPTPAPRAASRSSKSPAPQAIVPAARSGDQPVSPAPASKGKQRTRRSRLRERAEKKLAALQVARAKTQNKIDKLDDQLRNADIKVRRLRKTALAADGGSQERAEIITELRAAEAVLNKLKEDDELGGYREERTRQNAKEEAILESLALKRPTLLQSTKATVRAAAKMQGDKFLDANTGEVITGVPVFGHIYGREHRRLVLEAEERGMNQEQFDRWVNSHPEWFQLETKANNESHRFEKPGID